MSHPIEKVRMTKKWIAITLLLLVIAGLLARQLRISVLRFYAKNDLSKIQPVQDVKQKTVQEKTVPPLAALKKYNPADFNIIPETNVFSEYRAKEEKVEVAAPPEPAPLTQKPILVGVTIIDTMKKASIIEPGVSSQDKNRRAQLKRIGDVYHGYTITEINAANIVLESGTKREIIPLHEGSKKTQAGKTSILSTRVVIIGGGSSGGTQAGVASGSSAKAAVASVGSSSAGNTPAASAPAPTPAQRAATPEAASTTARPVQQQRNQNSETDSQGRRVIRTPFGTITRPNKD
jgi:hypothetical protein